jgi:hypothetical protein
MKLVVSLFLLALGVARMVDAKAAPVVHREDIEWCNVWIPDATNAKLPRVLLIGDSISMSYYDRVHDSMSST